MPQYKLAGPARDDIIDILHWSEENFGEALRDRYAALIATAIRDVAAAPGRVGSAARAELGDGLRSWHLRGSRDHTEAPRVRRPRHVMFYAVEEDGLVVIVRLLHEAMDPSQHLDPDPPD